jgi:hypothetical protein
LAVSSFIIFFYSFFLCCLLFMQCVCSRVHIIFRRLRTWTTWT